MTATLTFLVLPVPLKKRERREGQTALKAPGTTRDSLSFPTRVCWHCHSNPCSLPPTGPVHVLHEYNKPYLRGLKMLNVIKHHTTKR